jgi:hypothetical protein
MIPLGESVAVMQWYSANAGCHLQVEPNAKRAKSKSTPFDRTTLDIPVSF